MKDVRADDLVHAVRVAMAGEALLAPAVTRRLIDSVRAAGRAAILPRSLDVLTEREREVRRFSR